MSVSPWLGEETTHREIVVRYESLPCLCIRIATMIRIQLSCYSHEPLRLSVSRLGNRIMGRCSLSSMHARERPYGVKVGLNIFHEVCCTRRMLLEQSKAGSQLTIESIFLLSRAHCGHIQGARCAAVSVSARACRRNSRGAEERRIEVEVEVSDSCTFCMRLSPISSRTSHIFPLYNHPLCTGNLETSSTPVDVVTMTQNTHGPHILFSYDLTRRKECARIWNLSSQIRLDSRIIAGNLLSQR